MCTEHRFSVGLLSYWKAVGTKVTRAEHMIAWLSPGSMKEPASHDPQADMKWHHNNCLAKKKQEYITSPSWSRDHMIT